MDQSELAGLYEQYLGRAPDESGIATWSGQDAASVIAGITGSQEYQQNQANQGGGGGDSGGGGGGGGQDINQIYQQYLGRDVDPSGAQTYAGWAPQDIINAVTGSQEYANRGGLTSGGLSGGQDLNSIYQQYLGRDVDPSGAQTFSGWAPQDVINAVVGSQEYANRGGNAGGLPSTGGTDVNSLYQQYLGRDVDPGGAANWAGKSFDEIVAGITGSQEYQTLHPGAPVITGSPSDPSTWEEFASFNRDPNNPDNQIMYYRDPKTGNVYSTKEEEGRQLIASGSALEDPYLKSIGLPYTDPTAAQELYNLKAKDPNQYYEQVADKLNKQIYESYQSNANYDDAYNKLQSIKDVNPQAYYKNQLDFLSKQAGWQEGQNTSERAAPVIEQIRQLAPQAQAAGLSADQINNIVGTGYSTANVQNQQRIANLAASGGSGFNFGKDVMPGISFIAVAAATAASAGSAAPLGATLLGSAAATVGPIATTALGGAVIGAGMGALTSAAYGGNIGQGAIKGAISGGVGGAASGATSQLSAAASGLVGPETISQIAEATNLSKDQVSAIIANTAATTLAAAATGQVNGGNFAQTVGTALASSAISAYAGNVAKAIDPNMAQSAINAVSSVANVATNTVLKGGNIQNALMSSIPSIVGGYGRDVARENTGLQFAGTTPFGTENVGLTSGGVDSVLQSGLDAAPERGVGFTTGAVDNELQRGLSSAPTTLESGPLTRVPEANTEAFFAAVQSGDKELIDAVKSGDTKVINAINRGDMIEAVALSKEATGALPSGEKSFGQAFSDARSKGAKTFEWNGKPYTTEVAPKPTTSAPEDVKKVEAIPTTEKPGILSSVNKFIGNLVAPSTTTASQPSLNYTSPMGDIGFSDAANIDQSNKAVQAVNEAQARFSDVPRGVVSAGSQGMAELGRTYSNALASTGLIDYNNAFAKESDAIVKAARDLMPADVKAQEQNIVDRIKSADGWGNKAIEGIKAAYENPKGFLSYLTREGIQEGLQLSTGVAAFKLAGYVPALGVDLTLQAGESYGDTYGQAYDTFKKQGLSDEQARQQSILPAAISGAATAITAGIVDATLLKSLAGDLVQSGLVKSGVPIAAKEYVTEYAETMVQALATQYATTGKFDFAKAEDEATLSATIGAHVAGPISVAAGTFNPVEQSAQPTATTQVTTTPTTEITTEPVIDVTGEPTVTTEPIVDVNVQPTVATEPELDPNVNPNVNPEVNPNPNENPNPNPNVNPNPDVNVNPNPDVNVNPNPEVNPNPNESIDTLIDIAAQDVANATSAAGRSAKLAALKKLMQQRRTNDLESGIQDLAPGLTKAGQYTLGGIPANNPTYSPIMPLQKFATGGFSTTSGSDVFAGDMPKIAGSLTPGLSKANIAYILTGLPGNPVVAGHAEGGAIEEHNPEFYSEGGLSSMENRYVEGEGDGTSDSVPAMLANGEFVIPADVVASLGNGSNEAGASVLDQFLKTIRDHKHSKGSKGLPPESKGPLAYLTDAKRKVKA